MDTVSLRPDPVGNFDRLTYFANSLQATVYTICLILRPIRLEQQLFFSTDKKGLDNLTAYLT